MTKSERDKERDLDDKVGSFFLEGPSQFTGLRQGERERRERAEREREGERE